MSLPALDGETIKGLVSTLLARNLDEPRPTPDFHTKLWDLACSPAKRVAVAAPRSHAKSTAVAFAYTIACSLFRQRKFTVLVSATEGLAAEHLRNIKRAISDNSDLKALFGVDKLTKDTETDCIVRMNDGHKFRILAKGAEQKVRGLLWEGVRPDLIVCDDLEEDEAVLNRDRREKFKKWFFSALLPCLSSKGIVRVVGTILHFDSLLENLLNDKSWSTARFRAHDPDFKNILWPERFTEDDFRSIRASYINQGYPEGYSQEYLNYPIDESTQYFRRGDLLSMEDEDYSTRMEYYAGADLAISQDKRAAYSVICVIGVDTKGTLYLVDVRRGRWDSLEIIDEMFSVQQRYSPEIFTVESEKIQKALGPILYNEMHKRNSYLNLNLVTPSKDKMQRARGVQARMRAGGIKFDKKAEWYNEFETELVRFPKGSYSDQVDAFAWTGLTIDKIAEARTPKEVEEELYEEEVESASFLGRSSYTGY